MFTPFMLLIPKSPRVWLPPLRRKPQDMAWLIATAGIVWVVFFGPLGGDYPGLAGDVLAVVAEETVAGGSRISRTGSIGIAVSNPSSTATSLLRDADQALLEAKARGRSRWHLLQAKPGSEHEPYSLEQEHEIRGALDARQFVVHYQPLVRLQDARVCGHEALVRWNHPTRGLLSPAAFMETMETSALVVQLGQQVLEQVCERLRLDPNMRGPVSVNVSAVEVGERDWSERFLQTVQRYGVQPSYLIVELTETTLHELRDEALQSLRRLRSAGVGIHVDDFGTGYTSVGALQRLPLTGLKLDRSFVSMLPDAQNLALVRAISGLAESLGLESIAEGIETEKQAGLLREAGWSCGQGYLFGRPAAEPLL